jgi:hypothetical protein
MHTHRFLGREFGLEFQPQWRFGRQRFADAFGTRLYWLGPVHIAVCALNRRQPR